MPRHEILRCQSTPVKTAGRPERAANVSIPPTMHPPDILTICYHGAYRRLKHGVQRPVYTANAMGGHSAAASSSASSRSPDAKHLTRKMDQDRRRDHRDDGLVEAGHKTRKDDHTMSGRKSK